MANLNSKDFRYLSWALWGASGLSLFGPCCLQALGTHPSPQQLNQQAAGTQAAPETQAVPQALGTQATTQRQAVPHSGLNGNAAPPRSLKAQGQIASSQTESAALQHREGKRLEQHRVDFRADSDGLKALIENDTVAIEVLKNLAAQRIFRATRDDPDDGAWTIHGFITEFEGRNFLFIEKAVRFYADDKVQAAKRP